MIKSQESFELKELLKEDLANEYYHMLFYLKAASIVSGPHREEYKEFFLKEAQSELMHVHEFTNAIVYVSGETKDIHTKIIPDLPKVDQELFNYYSHPVITDILDSAIFMEDQVADTYAKRLKRTDEMETTMAAWVHLFYEDQLQDSWAAAQEMRQLSKMMS